jgi:OOP family OmpA-OmpF porin
LERARAAGRLLPAGSPALDLSAVADTDGSVIARLRAAIQASEIHFEVNGSLPTTGQEALLDQLADELKQLVALSPDARITMTGHTDATGQETFDLTLSLARAEAVRALLKRRGIDPTLLAVRAAGRLEPQETSSEASSINRRVSLAVITEE